MHMMSRRDFGYKIGGSKILFVLLLIFQTSHLKFASPSTFKIFSVCAVQFVSDLVGSPEDVFCRDAAQ